MGLLGRGRVFLKRTLPDADGRTVTYTRGATSAGVTAWPGRTDRDDVLNPNPTARSVDRERDYLFTYAAIDAAGFHPPEEGDRITETLNGESVVWQVVKRDRSPVWEWSDAEDRTSLRVHCRKV